MRPLATFVFVTLALLCLNSEAFAQKRILVDVGHGQKFYSDPADKISTDLVPTDRLTYMTGELTKNGAAHDATIGYLKTPITGDALSKTDLLFIHIPSKKYSADEVAAIKKFVENGGSLFLAMEENYWATLEQVNVNDIVAPFGITFKSDSPDKTSGGHSIRSKITKVEYPIPSHGARLVEGGTPFAYSNASPNANPIAVYTETKGGGKVVATGEAMASLYMTSWQGVNDYKCGPFMEDVIGWLVK